MIKLNELETLNVVIAFLEHHFELTKPDDTGIIFKSLLRMKNSKDPVNDDSIIWSDWCECSQALNQQNGIFSEEDAFKLMISFLEKYFNRTNSDDIRSVLSDLLYKEYGATSDPGAWYDWQECLAKVKKE